VQLVGHFVRKQRVHQLAATVRHSGAPELLPPIDDLEIVVPVRVVPA